jgi:hypothetical protein
VAATVRANGGAAEHDLTTTNWAIGGYPYSFLKKNGFSPAYANSIESVRRALLYAPLSHTGVKVPGLISVHGESDSQSATYQTDIRAWQADYQADINAVTGRADTIPIFHSQNSAWTSASLATVTGAPYAMLSEHETNPTKTILVCSKYFLTHAADGLHLVAASYRILGEYYGKAWYQHIVQGVQWEPLRPISQVRSGATITVSFTGRVGNLVLDTTTVSDPGNYGFEWVQTGGTAQTISSVALSGDSTQVIITLSGDPGTPATQRLRYAYTGTPGNSGGPTTGPRGCVHDSDTTVGIGSGATLVNWLVHFDKAVSP